MPGPLPKCRTDTKENSKSRGPHRQADAPEVTVLSLALLRPTLLGTILRVCVPGNPTQETLAKLLKNKMNRTGSCPVPSNLQAEGPRQLQNTHATENWHLDEVTALVSRLHRDRDDWTHSG